MRTTLIAVAAFLVGLVLGLGIHHNRDVEEIRRFRSIVGLTDEQIHDVYQSNQTVMGAMETSDGVSALTCLEALKRMHNANESSAQELLARRVAEFYVIYGPPDSSKHIDDTTLKILRKIDSVKGQIPELQKALQEALANVNSKP
jgi:hypothetical protein